MLSHASEPIMWQQRNAQSHEDTGQELQVMFISNIRRGGGDLTMVELLVRDGLV